MSAIKIIPLPLGPFQVNTYIVTCRETGQSAIIDPAGEPETIIDTLKREKATPCLILNTHGHPDHVLANAALKAALEVPVCMHAEDSDFFSDSPEIGDLERQTGLTVDTVADRLLTDDDRLQLGAATIQVLHTPGHTPGSCCFLVAGHLFTGDTLFVGDAGRTDLKGGSLDRLIRSIENKLFGLADDTRIWPGHNYGNRPTSTMGREKIENTYITDFILDP
ncbi:MAG: MBL fold metallo-hydrolase [Desulfosarcina sp.]|nr:MBL fold metallo-hydrolase [Desulfosarcina sp.]MBC2742689.1 MBL fold metallo-hydrolase [Desulfosarcina sp.]MBC2765599.1 MBL fold metallo-hydrolase [Desulfosarcina sp.]